ncbi:MAG: ComEC/Rec2 family competence protein [Patescibacteria group bacterium]
MYKKYLWPISFFSLSLGIILSHILFLSFEIIFFCSFFLSFYFLILFVQSNRNIRLINFFIFLSFIFLAFWRYTLIPSSNLSSYNNQDLVIRGYICNNPTIKNNSQRFYLSVISVDDNFEISGKVLIFTNNYPLYNYGDVLSVSGLFSEGGVIDNFNYSLYLKRYGVSLVSYYPDIDNEVEVLNFNKFRNFFYNLQKSLGDVFDGNLSSSSSAMARAIFLGDKNYLEQSDRDNFSKVGLSHIVAISGMHIGLLSTLLLNSFLAIGFSRKKSFYLILTLLVLYLFLISFPPSAIRAVIMGSLTLLGSCLGRDGDSSNLLYFSGIVLLLINPLLILADLGFQLSFLAVLGIIHLKPRIDILFSKLKIYSTLKTSFDILSVSISAQVFTAPILIYNFHQFSFIAPISNLLVVWTLPFLLIFIILALIFYIFLPFLSSVIFLLVQLLSNYIYFIANLLK